MTDEDQCVAWIQVSSINNGRVQGDISCSKSSCNSQTISLSGNGFEGRYDISSEEYLDLGIDILGAFESGTTSRRELLGGSNSAESNRSIAKSVLNPVVCLARNDGIWFDVSQGSYPIYSVNSLINTNEDFDYGETIMLCHGAFAY